MNLIGIAAVICIVVVIAGIAIVNAVSVDEIQDTTANSCGASCGNSCTSTNNCGLATCGATQGKSCGCKN